MPPIPQTIAPGVSFLSLPDSRFKTARLTAAFLLPLKEETAARYALVPHLLCRSCAAYPDMTALNRRLNQLYGARIHAGVSRVGDQQALLLTADCIDDRYALKDEPVAADCAKLLLSMIFNPALEDGVFREADVDPERRCLVEIIESEINEKRLYARHKCEQLLCPGEPYAVGVYGDIERAKALTPADATAAWKELLSTASILWIYQGGAEGADVAAAIGAGFAVWGDRRPAALTTGTAFTPPEQPVRRTETMAVNQSKLVMGFRVGIADPDEACMAARLMNALFGGTPHSMLFRSVREKLSLCYYCASSYDYIKGVMLVDSGVEAAKADEAQAEILRQLDLLRQGAFTDEDLEAARRSVLNQFQEVDDLQSSRMGWYLRQSVSTRFTSPEESAPALAAVTRDEVCAAARQVHPICVYLLQSEKGGED